MDHTLDSLPIEHSTKIVQRIKQRTGLKNREAVVRIAAFLMETCLICNEQGKKTEVSLNEKGNIVIKVR
jgi:hypothetical protein